MRRKEPHSVADSITEPQQKADYKRRLPRDVWQPESPTIKTQNEEDHYTFQSTQGSAVRLGFKKPNNRGEYIEL